MFKKNHRDGFLGKRMVWEVWEVLLNIFEIQQLEYYVACRVVSWRGFHFLLPF